MANANVNPVISPPEVSTTRACLNRVSPMVSPEPFCAVEGNDARITTLPNLHVSMKSARSIANRFEPPQTTSPRCCRNTTPGNAVSSP